LGDDGFQTGDDVAERIDLRLVTRFNFVFLGFKNFLLHDDQLGVDFFFKNLHLQRFGDHEGEQEREEQAGRGNEQVAPPCAGAFHAHHDVAVEVENHGAPHESKPNGGPGRIKNRVQSVGGGKKGKYACK